MDYDILLGLGFGIIFLICPLILTLLNVINLFSRWSDIYCWNWFNRFSVSSIRF